MNLAVVVGIVSIIVCMAAVVRTWHDKEIDTRAALMIGIVVTFLVVGAVVLDNKEKIEDYNQNCTCSCECCGGSETE